jgi:hypothetical protein
VRWRVSIIEYRIIRGPTPTLEDFKSSKQLGKPLRDPRMAREWATGISVFDSLEYAAQWARAVHFRLGAWIIALSIPEDSSIEWAQTARDARHFTIYSPPFEALALVEGDAIFVRDD